jgi:hypothetical protein
MIVQSVPRAGEPSTLTFTVPTASLVQSVEVLKAARDQIGFDELLTDTDVVKVSAVGVGMRSNAGIAAMMFRTLADRGINILAITTSEIKVSVLIPRIIRSSPCACSTPPTGSTTRERRHERADQHHQHRPRPPSPPDEPRRRLPRLRRRDDGRRDELDFGAPPGFRDIERRRLRRDRLRGDDPGLARHGNRRDPRAHRPAVRRQSDHHAPAIDRADRGLRAPQVGHIVLAGGLPPSGSLDKIKAPAPG